MAGAIQEMGFSLGSLESSQITLALLSKKLAKLAEIHNRVGEITARHAEKDILILCSSVDEYVRLIGSIKVSFLICNKLHDRVTFAEQVLEKKNEVLAKYDNMKIRTDKISIASAEVTKAQVELEDLSRHFTKCRDLLFDELERVDIIKMQDFRESLKAFCSVMLECHEEMLSVWKTFYDVHDDTVYSNLEQ